MMRLRMNLQAHHLLMPQDRRDVLEDAVAEDWEAEEPRIKVWAPYPETRGRLILHHADKDTIVPMLMRHHARRNGSSTLQPTLFGHRHRLSRKC